MKTLGHYEKEDILPTDRHVKMVRFKVKVNS